MPVGPDDGHGDAGAEIHLPGARPHQLGVKEGRALPGQVVAPQLERAAAVAEERPPIAVQELADLEPLHVHEVPEPPLADVAEVVEVEVGHEHVVEAAAAERALEVRAHGGRPARRLPARLAEIDEQRAPGGADDERRVRLADRELVDSSAPGCQVPPLHAARGWSGGSTAPSGAAPQPTSASTRATTAAASAPIAGVARLAPAASRCSRRAMVRRRPRTDHASVGRPKGAGRC